MRAASIISCGLRLSGTNGPKTSVIRSFWNSMAAFFCASVCLSAGMGGSRSWANDRDAVPYRHTTHTEMTHAALTLVSILLTPRCCRPILNARRLEYDRVMHHDRERPV